MTPRDPTHEILKAYYNVLNDTIMLDGSAVAVGTKIPKRASDYVLIYVEAMDNRSTSDTTVYHVTVAMQIVSMQDINEGDESRVNSIFEQILEVIGDEEMLLMNNFKALTSMPGSMDRDTELTDSNYIITRKLRMLNFIQQTK